VAPEAEVAAGAVVGAGAEVGAVVGAGIAVGAAVAAPPQAASNMLAAITSETKTNKRLDISYSSEYYFFMIDNPQCGYDGQVDKTFYCQPHLLSNEGFPLT